MTNVKAFYSCDLKAIKISTLLSFDVVEGKSHSVATQNWVGGNSLILLFSGGSRPFDSFLIRRNFPLFLPSAKSLPDPAITERTTSIFAFSSPCEKPPNLLFFACNQNSLLTFTADMANKADEPSCRYFSLGANTSSPADGKSNPSTFKCSTSGAATSTFF